MISSRLLLISVLLLALAYTTYSVITQLPPFSGASLATHPVPRTDWAPWPARFQGNLDILKDGPYQLIFNGDSITELWQTPARGLEIWKTHYGALKAADFGISGDQVQYLLWRVQHGEVEGQDPKLIVLLIGTNNGGQDPKDIAAGIKLILNEYEKRCPDAHILLLGIFPRDHLPTAPNRAWIAKINAILSTYNDDKRATYMDIGSKFLQPDGTLSTEIMPDYLHPSAKGFEIWANAIQPIIDEYFPAATTK